MARTEREVISVSNTIVLALDGAEGPSAPVRYATELAREREARIVVVHVRELTGGRGAGTLHADEDDRTAQVRRQVADLRSRGFEADLRITSSLRRPAALIVEAARSASAEMIVVGGTTHRALVGALAGSTPLQLLHSSPCPVLVAPAREAAKATQPEADAGRTPIAA
jgi:nucleotide-binding universal stress UspA family protein